MSKTVEEKREMINAYLSKYQTTPLVFKGVGTNFGLINPTTEELVIKVLSFAETHGSYKPETVENGLYETSPSRYRSSLDIWRHIIFYYPDVTIFQVMTTIRKIQEKLYGQYCTTVLRRVFKCKQDYHFIYAWQPECNNKYTKDEYGLTFAEWAKL